MYPLNFLITITDCKLEEYKALSQ